MTSEQEAVLATIRPYADPVFYWCVDVLKKYSAMLGMTYEELNVLVFCIIEPIAFIVMTWAIVRLWRRNRKLTRITASRSGQKHL